MTTEQITRITAADLDANGYYREDSLAVEGRLEIEANLGWVRFRRSLFATLSIEAGEGTGITAGRGIEAGTGITAGGGITAGEGMGVFAGLRVRLDLWTRYAIVTAIRRPENLVSGHWQERPAANAAPQNTPTAEG